MKTDSLTIWGEKTLQVKQNPSPLDRVNVRHLVMMIEDEVMEALSEQEEGLNSAQTI